MDGDDHNLADFPAAFFIIITLIFDTETNKKSVEKGSLLITIISNLDFFDDNCTIDKTKNYNDMLMI